nr:hypothetical protein [Bradyrhizobium diazoefficiens]
MTGSITALSFQSLQHKIEQAHDVRRARSPDGQRVAPRGVAKRIARMIDRRDDEAGVGQRLRRIVLLAEKSAAAVREDDEGKFCARDRTILHALQVEIGADRKIAKRHMRRLRGARVPDRA